MLVGTISLVCWRPMHFSAQCRLLLDKFRPSVRPSSCLSVCPCMESYNSSSCSCYYTGFHGPWQVGALRKRWQTGLRLL